MNRIPSWLRRPSVLPLRVFGTVVLIAFLAEYLIMVVIDRVGLEEGTLAVAFIDAATLTLLLSPAVWVVVVRPLRELFEARGRLLGRVFEAQELERGRLARDLHDDLGQQLTAILVRLRPGGEGETVGSMRVRLAEASDLVSKSLDATRRLARGLRPSLLEDLGLGPAAERMCEDFESAHTLPVTLELGLEPGKRLPPAVENHLFRILQESLTNVARHARASSVRVSLNVIDHSVELSVSDDGEGFDIESADSGGGAFGLRGMRERASLVDGEIFVTSAAGAGTRVRVVVPI